MEIVNSENLDGTSKLIIVDSLRLRENLNMLDVVEEFISDLSYKISDRSFSKSFLKTEYDIELKFIPKYYLNFLHMVMDLDNDEKGFNLTYKLVTSTSDNLPELLVDRNKYTMYFKISEEEAQNIEETKVKYLPIMRKRVELELVDKIKKIREE